MELYNIWNKIKFDFKPYFLTLRGYNRASERTSFYIPELKLCFEAGIQSPYKPEYVLISSPIITNVCDLPMIISSNNNVRIYVPEEYLTKFKNFINSSYLLTLDKKIEYNIYGICNNNQYITIESCYNYFIRVYKISDNCVGYGIFKSKEEIKKEYIDLPKEEYVKLLINNINYKNTVQENILLYFPNNTLDVLDKYPDIFTYSYIMIDCMYLMSPSEECIGKHTQWSKLKPIILAHPRTHFILININKYYYNNDIQNFKIDNVDIKNFTVFF